MTGMIDPAGKDVVIDCTAPPFQPSKQACPHIRRNLELDGTACLFLDDHGTGTDFLTCDEGSDLELHQIAAPQLAVDCEIK